MKGQINGLSSPTANSQQPTANSQQPTANSQQPMKRILVIDDEKGVRDAYALALKGQNYLVAFAETGNKGLALYTQNTFDLIFLDLNMPGMRGTDVLRNIRGADKDTPIYIVTAFSEAYTKELQQIQGNFDLLCKPVSGEQIRQVVEGALG